MDNETPKRIMDTAGNAGEATPSNPIPKPQVSSDIRLDPGLIEALPLSVSEVLSARHYELQIVRLGSRGRAMIEGEYESLKALYAVSPTFVPVTYSWGSYKNKATGVHTHFLLTQCREIADQPPNPVKFTARLAELHRNSKSPTGKFGFHITTCHAKLPQLTDCWTESWETLYKKQLAHMVHVDEEEHGAWPEFRQICKLILDKVIPLLSESRTIKPCLVHEDLWDENTATDMEIGEPFAFDAGAFYAHNEYELGNWRAARNKLSARIYVDNYKKNYPPSEPVDEWDDRNLLYPLRYDLGYAILFPGSNTRLVMKENMALLCANYFPADLQALQTRHR
ncbi:Uu.00g007540.m01.CDS01 [Anthostomella pinea]|uniref:protein-ribulosamine 3-kinase n=1 Tax=Anthostomella pinea TaxID=933095 RepID=A0AAI8YPV1_9PEZI|nr:Uu.00g007540.m01.CDS01 [Anthostomella pinea]